jgi:hypothetical protein
MRKRRAILGSSRRFVSVSASRFPGRSGTRSVRSSRMRTNPARIAARRYVEPAARSPRRDADERRALDELAGEPVQSVGDLRGDEARGHTDHLAEARLVADRARIAHGARIRESARRVSLRSSQ